MDIEINQSVLNWYINYKTMALKSEIKVVSMRYEAPIMIEKHITFTLKLISFSFSFGAKNPEISTA